MNRMEIIDWRLHRHEGSTYLVQIVPDDEGNPVADDDYADPDQIRAWERGAWRYVIVYVSAAPDRIMAVGGVEWGDLPGAATPCGWDYVLGEVGHDLIFDLEGK